MGQSPYLFKFFVFFVAMKTYPHIHSRAQRGRQVNLFTIHYHLFTKTELVPGSGTIDARWLQSPEENTGISTRTP